MKMRIILSAVFLVVFGTACAVAGQPIEGPRTYRLYSGITAYVDNREGRDFAVRMDLRDLNIYGNGPREVLVKVYDPDGAAVVRECIHRVIRQARPYDRFIPNVACCPNRTVDQTRFVVDCRREIA